MVVELKYASLPVLRKIPVHYWFVTNDGEKRERWEVWQRPNVRGTGVDYLHRNLMHPDSNVGGGPSHLESFWVGAEADDLTKALRESFDTYPYRTRYRAYPGPNSNTFVSWILDRAKIKHDLSWRGIGKNYRYGLRAPTPPA